MNSSNMENDDQPSLQNTDFYYNYKDDPTLLKEAQPCQIRHLFQYADLFDKILIVLGCIFALGNGISLIFYAQPLKNLIMAFDPYTTIEEIKKNVSFAFRAFIYNSIFVFVNATFMTIAWKISSQRQLIRMRNIYYKSLLNQEFAWYDRNKPEDVCSEMYILTQKAQSGIADSLNSLLSSFSMTFGGIVFAFTHGWRMALVISLFMPIMIASNYIRAKLWTKWEVDYTKRIIDINGYIIQLFQNIKTVKYLAGQEYETNEFNKKVQSCSDQYIRLTKKNAVSSAIGFFCILFNYALAFWYGAKLIADRTYNENTGAIYDVGDVVSIFFCIYISNLNIGNIPGTFANFHNARIAVTRIINIINRKARQSQGSEDCLQDIEQIQFKNVSFQYNKPLFNGLNLKIKRGVIAIVGSSGNGKSTLVNLIMKFYQPFKGEIIFKSKQQSQHLKNINSKHLRTMIGYVGQEPVLLGESIIEVLGNNKYREQHVWSVLDMCCAGEFVREIGLYSKFHSLSGGQKQRIAIARAVLRQPQILILDEGTSALDHLNEKNLLKNITSKSNIKFIIMVAHRVQTLSEAETIIKVDNGQAYIIQFNNHNKEQAQVQKPLKDGLKQVVKEGFDVIGKVQLVQQGQKKEQKEMGFKWKYFGILLNLNRQQYKLYVYSILSAMLLGFIFPSFSYIITLLCSIATDLKYATSDLQIQQLRAKSQKISLLLILISVFSILLTIIKQNTAANIGQNVGKKLKRIAMSVLTNLQMAEIDRIGKSDLVQVIAGNSQGARQLVSSLIINISEDLFTLVCGLGIAFIYCWQITIFSLLLIPLSLIFGKSQQLFLTSLSQNADKVQRKTHQILSLSIIQNRTIKSLNLEDFYYERYCSAQWKGFKVALKHIILSGITLGMSQSMVSIMISMIYYVGAIFMESFDIKVIDLFTAIYAVMFSGVQVGCHIGLINTFTNCSVSTSRYFNLVNIDQNSSYHKQQAHQILVEEEIIEENHKVDEGMNGLIQFNNIHYKYSNRQQYLFEGLSFKVKPLQTLAIVGQSGNGKTTIADLLLKIYKPNLGQILIDGIDLNLYQKKELSTKLSIVSQEPALFNRSIYQNIRYNTEASMDQVQEAAKIANAFSFIEQGGFGNQNQEKMEIAGSNWQRIVGSRGSLLSGGQKQRVAIARAIVRRPKILILDEATSALDKERQQRVINSINSVMNVTKIVIAHRLSTIRLCDRIIVLKKGNVIQDGTYAQLIQKKGQFFKLVNELQNE